MEVTSVDVQPVDYEDNNLLAWVVVVFDEEFLVRNIRLVEADSGLVVAMPNEEFKGELRDIAHPITSECRQKIEEAVLGEYNRQVGDEQQI